VSAFQNGGWSRLRWVVMVVSLAIAAWVGVLVFHFLAVEDSTPVGYQGVDVRVLETQERAAFQAKWDEMARRQEVRIEQARVESELRRQESEAMAAKQPPRKGRRVRRVRRWAWLSPAEKRAKIWNVPKRETDDAVVTGLVRICTSEQQGSVPDCVGIWQVLNNIRSRSCNRSYTQLITECDENGETLLSAMGRASRYVVGVVEPKHRRQRWIARLETDCEMPRFFEADVRRYCKGRDLEECAQQIWETQHRRDCESTVKLARGLVSGKRPRRITRARVIAWGGRCEDPGGACDDRLACARGLARVPHLEKGPQKTANGFWCRPGSGRSCPDDIDPVCIKMGYQSLQQQQVVSSEDVPLSSPQDV
jgi:hypothetical protein